MKIFKLAKAFFLNDVREFNGFFWPFVFPLILFFILSSVFSGFYNDEGVSFKLGVFKEEEPAGFGKIVSQVLEQISPKPFQIVYFDDFEEAQRNLQLKKIDVVLKIPKGLNLALARSVLFAGEAVKLEVYTLVNSTESETAGRILQSIFQSVDVEMTKQILSRTGGKYTPVEFELKPIEKRGISREFKYTTYIFPAILLMSILSLAVFNLSLNLIYNREAGVNKKLYTTPIKALEYFFSLGLSIFVSMVLSCILIYMMGLGVYKVSTLSLSLSFIAKLLYSMLVCFSIGMMIVSFCKRFSTAMVVAQISYQIMMFLGGFYFPILSIDMPFFIKAIAYVLPTTYLVENLRVSLYHSVYDLSQLQLWLVPSVWFVASIVLFSLNFKKVMAYE
ncbi:ABC transporter permease [Pseudothermotoga sp.]|nr:ABC transporter permease [Pseudothermotoga sp.]MCX7813555.1 ABC transporter permease [Pseudothermotoga sp.]MDW8140041.1 ABC transporter permease [Pseudothermotoga sp.]